MSVKGSTVLFLLFVWAATWVCGVAIRWATATIIRVFLWARQKINEWLTLGRRYVEAICYPALAIGDYEPKADEAHAALPPPLLPVPWHNYEDFFGPHPCDHPQVSLRGSNQFVIRRKCVLCNMILAKMRRHAEMLRMSIRSNILRPQGTPRFSLCTFGPPRPARFRQTH